MPEASGFYRFNFESLTIPI